MNPLYEIPDISDHAKALLKTIDDRKQASRYDKHEIFADSYTYPMNREHNDLEGVYGYNRNRLADKAIPYTQLKHYKHVSIHVNEQSLESFKETLFVECIIIVPSLKFINDLCNLGCQFKDCTLETFVNSKIQTTKLDSGELNGKIAF